MTIFVFLFGALFTSFYTLIGMRIPNKASIHGRSQCDQCQEVIPWYALIPIFGWFIVKGKCVKCKTRISIKYPIYEITGGLLFSVGYFVLQSNLIEFAAYSVFISLMIIVTVSDIEYQIVPDIILLIFLPLILTLRIAEPIEGYLNVLLGGFLGFLFMFLIAWYGQKRFKKEALGGGDIKLYFLIGLFLGARIVFLSLFFASLLGIILGRIVMKKMNPIPFVPFIFFGSILAYFFGYTLLDWYMGLFF